MVSNGAGRVTTCVWAALPDCSSNSPDSTLLHALALSTRHARAALSACPVIMLSALENYTVLPVHQLAFCFAHLQECHCMLFLTEDNDFRGDDQAITLDEVTEATKGMSGVQR